MIRDECNAIKIIRLVNVSIEVKYKYDVRTCVCVRTLSRYDSCKVYNC